MCLLHTCHYISTSSVPRHRLWMFSGTCAFCTLWLDFYIKWAKTHTMNSLRHMCPLLNKRLIKRQNKKDLIFFILNFLYWTVFYIILHTSRVYWLKSIPIWNLIFLVGNLTSNLVKISCFLYFSNLKYSSYFIKCWNWKHTLTWIWSWASTVPAVDSNLRAMLVLITIHSKHTLNIASFGHKRLNWASKALETT